MKRLILLVVLIASAAVAFVFAKIAFADETSTVKETSTVQELTADKVEIKNIVTVHPLLKNRSPSCK